MDTYPHITVDRQGDVFCVRLRRTRLDETEVSQTAEEILALIRHHGCRRLAISLGPEPPDCLYSIFLAKLVTIQRVIGEHGGHLALCEASPVTKSVFEACRLDRAFTFVPDVPGAVAYLSH